MRTLLVGALASTLVGCSHQLPPSQAAADSCASRNPLACWMSVRVPIEPALLTINFTPRESELPIARKARATAVGSRTAQRHPRTDAENVSAGLHHSSRVALP